MAIVNNRLFETVLSGQAETKEDVIPNGETWDVHDFSAFSNDNSSTYCALLWDYGGAGEEIVALCYGTVSNNHMTKILTGDGSKKLAIVLDNGSNDDLPLGCEYFAKVT